MVFNRPIGGKRRQGVTASAPREVGESIVAQIITRTQDKRVGEEVNTIKEPSPAKNVTERGVI